jgi:Immune inhibitor A peptidase M6
MSMRKLMHSVAVGAVVTALAAYTTPALAHTVGEPGDPTMLVHINDSEAGGSYHQVFERAYAGTAPDGTPVYIYVPEGGIGGAEGVDSLDPAFDQNPDDEFTPCADNVASDYLLTQEQINLLGDELANHIVAVDEAHFGDIGTAVGEDGTSSDALVMLVYNVQDESYYDCSVTTYTAGYFAPEYITDAGMNVIVVDAYDWANRIGDDAAAPNLYEGVIAHELEHLLMNYSDPGEPSWVDEGLADLAIFLNGYNIGGSHITYHQVFHRETSLTRWGGGLENYGASLTYFLYLWEQAGGNGDGTYNPDGEYDGAGGDLLIKLIFQHAADGMEGVQAAIDEFNAITGANLRSAEELFKDWAIAVKLDDEGSDRWDIKNIDFGDPAFTSWTVDIANDLFWSGRGQYFGRMPEAKWQHFPKVPAQTALPFGVSYETFRNPGRVFGLTFEGSPSEQVAPHTGDTHWWGGAESQNENILDVDSAGTAPGAVVDFWTWYFIEEGWDYGYLEALVNGEWVTVPLFDESGTEVTTDTNPHDNNEEGNGLTGTSGGAYFVDDPTYIHLQSAPLPAGTTDVRFRYSTDAAYLDTGFFVDDVTVGGQAATLSSEPGNWIETTGVQDNNWVVQVLSPCDLTPGETSEGEIVDNQGNYVYRFEGDAITAEGFSTDCLRATQDEVTVVISNLTSGDIQVLDADYFFRLTGSSGAGQD